MHGIPCALLAPVALALACELAPARGVGVGFTGPIRGPHDRVRCLDECAIAALREISSDLRESDMAAIRISERRQQRAGPELRAILAEAPSEIFDGARERALQQPLRLSGGAILVREELLEVAADDLAGRVT